MKPRRLQSETSFSRTSDGAVAGMAKCTQPCPDRDVPTKLLVRPATLLLLGRLAAQCFELRLLLRREAVLQFDHQAELGTLDVALGV